MKFILKNWLYLCYQKWGRNRHRTIPWEMLYSYNCFTQKARYYPWSGSYRKSFLVKEKCSGMHIEALLSRFVILRKQKWGFRATRFCTKCVPYFGSRFIKIKSVGPVYYTQKFKCEGVVIFHGVLMWLPQNTILKYFRKAFI